MNFFPHFAFRIPVRTRNTALQICREVSVKKFLLERSGIGILASATSSLSPYFSVREFLLLLFLAERKSRAKNFLEMQKGKWG